MATQIIEFSHEIDAAHILSYLSVDFSNEIEFTGLKKTGYIVHQTNQSSVYTATGKVIITTKMFIEFAESELLKSA